MAIEKPSTCTDEDIAAIIAYLHPDAAAGSTTGLTTEDIETLSGFLVNGVPAELSDHIDDIMVVCLMNGEELSTIVDPYSDNEKVQVALEEMYWANQDNANLSADLKTYFDEQGIDLSILDHTADIISGAYASGENTDLTDEQTENMTEIAVQMGPSTSELLWEDAMSTQEFADDFNETMADKLEDWADEMDDQLSDLEFLDIEGNPEDQAQSIIIQNKITSLNTCWEIMKTMQETVNKMPLNKIEMVSDYEKSKQNTIDGIMRNLV